MVCDGPQTPLCSIEEGPQAECVAVLPLLCDLEMSLHVLLASPHLCSELPGERKSLTHCKPSRSEEVLVTQEG